MKKLIILLLLLPFLGCEKEAISQNKSSEKYNILAIGTDTAQGRIIYSAGDGLTIQSNAISIVISDTSEWVNPGFKDHGYTSEIKPKKKLTEQQIIKNAHIDFIKEYISFVIHGLIEIDGHVFLNDTCKSPVVYKADLDGITIIKDGIKYKHRKCNISGCNIIHLEPIDTYLTDPIFKSVLHCTPNIDQVPMQIGSDLKIINP